MNEPALTSRSCPLCGRLDVVSRGLICRVHDGDLKARVDAALAQTLVVDEVDNGIVFRDDRKFLALAVWRWMPNATELGTDHTIKVADGGEAFDRITHEEVGLLLGDVMRGEWPWTR